ncbi:MAG: hypothetical protein AB8G77_11680 [Rhodothermales bacterium]
MSAFSKAISRASLSIAFGALSTAIAIIAAEKLLISKLSAGLLAIGLFFVGSILGSMFDEWIRSKKAQVQSERELITALEGLMEGIPEVASKQMNKQVNELSLSIQRMKAQMAAKGIRYIPQDKPFQSPPANSKERSEALRMCQNAKKLLDFAINMGDSEETITTLTAEVDHWLNVLNQPGPSVQGRA